MPLWIFASDFLLAELAPYLFIQVFLSLFMQRFLTLILQRFEFMHNLVKILICRWKVLLDILFDNLKFTLQPGYFILLGFIGSKSENGISIFIKGVILLHALLSLVVLPSLWVR